MSSLKQKTVSSFIWKFLERSGASLVQLLVQIVMARLLAPEDFGLLAIILVFVSIGNVIVQSGLSTAVIQASYADNEDFSTVFWMSFSLSVILYLVIFVTSPYIGLFYGTERIVWPIRVLTLVLVVNALNSVQVAFVQRNLEFKKIFKATIISVVISGVVGILMALLDFGLWALVVQQLSYQGINCLVLFGQISWHPTLAFNPTKARRHFMFGWKLLASGLLNTAYNSLSDLIIGKQFSTLDLGFVSQGKKYPQAIGTILDGTMQSVILAAVAKVQSDKSRVKHLTRLTLKTSVYLIVPAMLLFAVAAEPLVRLVLGEQWQPAVPFLQMYCFIYALLPIHTSNLQALNGIGRSDLFLKLELIKKAYGTVFILVGAFVFQDVYILVGSYMLSGIISTFVNAWPNRKVIGYSYLEQVKDICPTFLLAAASAGLAIPIGFLVLPDLVTILLQATVMVAAYLGFSKLFRIETLDYLLVTAKEVVVRKKG